MEFLSDIASLINSTLRISTPLVFAAMAGIFAERSGVIDFSLEGKMLMAAFVAAVGSYFLGNPWLGLLLAIGRFILVTLTGVGVSVRTLRGHLRSLTSHPWLALGSSPLRIPRSRRISSKTLPGTTSITVAPTSIDASRPTGETAARRRPSSRKA